MSKAQRLSDELRTSDDYDFLECEILPLFDAVDALQQSHDRLLELARDAIDFAESCPADIITATGITAPVLRAYLRDAIEKARNV